MQVTSATPRPGAGTRWFAAHGSTLLLSVVSLIGVAAFAYPFVLSAPLPGGIMGAHAADAPLLVGVLVPLLLVSVLADWGSRQASAKQIALLGVLTAINSVLRLPTGLGNSPTFFFLPILLGYAYGAQWGFLVGALSVFVSAFLTGLGPWLPFQMFAIGWLGMGAGALRPLRHWGRWPELIALAVYGYVGGLVCGALLNLWSWPFTVDGTPLAWQPGLGLMPTIQRYWVFYWATSFAWDTLHSLSTAALILVLGKPILATLRRFEARWSWQVVEVYEQR